MYSFGKSFGKFNRYVLACSVIVLFFYWNYQIKENSQSVSENISSCAVGNCNVIPKKSTLNNDKREVFVRDVINSLPDEYYRFTLKAKVVGQVAVKISVANSITEEVHHIGTVTVTGDESYLMKSFLFRTDTAYNGIVFEKIDTSSDSEIFIQDYKVSRLNVHSEEEMLQLSPVFSGSILMDQRLVEHSISKQYRNQINKNGFIFGQIFRAESDSLSRVSFGSELLNLYQGNNTDFVIELRESYKDDEGFHLKERVIEQVFFSSYDKKSTYWDFRDNKFNIEMNSYISKNNYYHIGIRSTDSDIRHAEYLKVSGVNEDYFLNRETYQYANGEELSYFGPNLNFRTVGFFSIEYFDQKIPSGVLIEDLGGGVGSYMYKSLGNEEEIFDIYSSTTEVNFDDDRKVLYGKASGSGEDYFEYKFDTQHPLDKLRVMAMQADGGWRRVSVSVSFDGAMWNKVAFTITDSAVYFLQEFKVPLRTKQFYVKISPEEPGKGKFGVKNLIIEGHTSIR